MRKVVTSLILLMLFIINTAVIIRHDVPDAAYLELASNYPAVGTISSDVEDFSCSCTLVAPDMVLTAAHCIDDSGDGIPDDPEDTNTSRVLFGADANNPTHSVAVEKYYLLPQWHQSGSLNRIDGNDIALLKLKTPITDIVPMKISISNPVGLVGTTVGYGTTTNGNTTELGAADGLRRAGQNQIEYRSTLGTGINDQGALHGDFDAPDGSTNTMNMLFEDLGVDQTSSATPLPLEGFGWGGDSGGPVCADFGDGAGNVIVGIASSSSNPINDDAPCGYGAIDVWASFANPGVKEFLESHNLDLHPSVEPAEPAEPTVALPHDIDISASPNGIVALPNSVHEDWIDGGFVKYTKIVAPNGKAIHFVAQNLLTDAQIVRSRNILQFFLTNYPGSQYGSDKSALANQMTENNATLALMNGTHISGVNEPDVPAQCLFQNEIAVEGHPWYINNDFSHRDAAFEEILHLFQDAGIGVDGELNTQPGVLPAYQAEIRAAVNHGLANNLYGIDVPDYIEEISERNDLTQEYLAAVVDTYYGLWAPWTEGNGAIWGAYIAKTREEMESRDPMGYALMPKIFSPYININMDIDPSFSGIFNMTFNANQPYTHKSQYLQHCTLTGTNASGLKGNDLDNELNGNSADNSLEGSKGNDRLDGKEGTDVAIFTGNFADYTITNGADNSVTVTDKVAGRDGNDILYNIENLQFADGIRSTSATEPTNPNPADLSEQQKVFQEFWDIYDKYYPLFPQKNINWQNVYDTYSPRVTANTTDQQLFGIFSEIMTTVIKDGHAEVVYNDDESVTFEQEPSAATRNMLANNTPNQVNIVANSANNPYISYGTLVADPDIGYINSKGFEPINENDFDLYKAIVDEALNALQSKKGIIVDIRTNGGGQGTYAYYLAGRFFATNTPIQIARKRVKLATGSSVDALSEWLTAPFEGYEDNRSQEGGLVAEIDPSEDLITASGSFQFTNKVALLTSVGTVSAAEWFTAAMKSQSHVKSFGETTFGIFAGSETLTLNSGNGKWKTRLSVQDVEMLYNGTYQNFEGIGITPDELLMPTTAQVATGADIHIDAGMAYIGGGTTQNPTEPTNPSPGNLTEQQSVFQEYWNVFDQYYPLFPQKNIDWQNVYDTYFPRITATTTDAQLLEIFKEINNTVLKDGHTVITLNNDQQVGFSIEDSEELRSMIANNTPNLVNFVASSINNPYISYGTLVDDPEIGFIQSKSFEPIVQEDAEFENFKAIVDEALNALQSKEGIIVDARDHAGGQPSFAFYLTGRFVADASPIEFLRTRVKISRGSTVASLSEWLTTGFDGYPDDRADGGLVAEFNPSEDIFSASGPFQYTNKVALLTARGAGSAAEIFVGAMKTQPHVKSIGELTQGIFAGIEAVTLKSGGGKWKIQLSILDVETLYNGSYQAFEGIGIPPDEIIRPTAADVADGLDVHIEAALDYIFDEEDEDDDGTRSPTDNQDVCLTIEANPNSNVPQLSVFTKYVNVFGLGVYAEAGISDEKVLHSAAVLAEYLDNDEDGNIDDPTLHNALLEGNMIVPIFEVEGSPAQQIFSENGDVYQGPAPMYDNEIVLTRPLVDAFDAALEEVMHNIHVVGYGTAYPEFFALAESSNSALNQAMDVARGGHFTTIPNPYPDGAWYTYEDQTCNYFCMSAEYFYWGLSSFMGMQNYGNRCEMISHEWRACTPEQFQATDTQLYNLFANPSGYVLPTVIPDGKYCPAAPPSMVDADNDGILADNDCNDNDASIGAKQAVGTACNDGNAATENDVITADGCSCAGTVIGNTGTKDWTLIVYLNGSDLETKSGEGTSDLAEMMAAGNTDNVNIIVLTGGAKKAGWETLKSWKIENGNQLPLNFQPVDNNMANPQNLTNFISWAIENYPANKYMLDLWNHGMDIRGYGHDENTDKEIKIPQLKEAIGNSSFIKGGNRFELLGFDACLMATIEVEATLANFTNYFVASEETEPGHGWDYMPVIAALNNGTATNGAALGTIIADAFKAQAVTNQTENVTLSVVNAAQLPPLVNALENLSNTIINDGAAALRGLQKARSKAEEYSPSIQNPEESEDMVDIGDMMKNLKKADPFLEEAADAVLVALNNAVVYSVNDQTRPNATGLSMFIPHNKLENEDAVFDAIDNHYDPIAFSEPFQSFVAGDYLDFALGDDSPPQGEIFDDEGALRGHQPSTRSSNSNSVFSSVRVANPDDLEEVRVILESNTALDGGEILLLGSTFPDTSYTLEDGSEVFGYFWDEFWLGLNGYPAYIADIYEYEVEEENGDTTYRTRVQIPVVLNPDEEGEGKDIILSYVFDDDFNITLESIVPETYGDEVLLTAKERITLQPGDRIQLTYEVFNEITDEESWAIDTEAIFEIVNGEEDLSLDYEPVEEGEYVLGFLLTDYSQNDTIILDQQTLSVVNTTVESFAANNIELLPNPTTGNLTINYADFTGGTYRVELYDLAGQLSYQQVFDAALVNLELGDLSNGYYLVKLISEGQIFSDKVIILK